MVDKSRTLIIGGLEGASIEDEVYNSYLDYAMSVIIGRAFQDEGKLGSVSFYGNPTNCLAYGLHACMSLNSLKSDVWAKKIKSLCYHNPELQNCSHALICIFFILSLPIVILLVLMSRLALNCENVGQYFFVITELLRATVKMARSPPCIQFMNDPLYKKVHTQIQSENPEFHV
jgi:hypothetical protein